MGMAVGSEVRVSALLGKGPGGPRQGLGGPRPLPACPHLTPQKARKVPTTASAAGMEPLAEGASFGKL